MFYPLCANYGSLKGKLLHATKENTELKEEVAYLTSHLERTAVSEKIIVDDLSRVEECATKSTYKLSVGFERCETRVRRKLPSLFLPPTITKRGNNQIHQNSLPI
jgi:predicted nuclease with TOPRIM domain